MQRLPKEMFSVLGSIPLARSDDGLDEGDFAQFRYQERDVVIRPTISKDIEWPTYWHEATEIALYDSGLLHKFDDDNLKEAVCDVMGTYLSAMMQAGMLRVVVPRVNT